MDGTIEKKDRGGKTDGGWVEGAETNKNTPNKSNKVTGKYRSGALQ